MNHPAPAPFTELTTDQQTLIGDLEMVALHTGEYLAKLRADILAAKRNAHWRQAAERVARDAYERASDDLVDALLNGLATEIIIAREDGYDLAKELRKAARGAA
ncbi:MAG: hypothetical protein Q8R82_01620 [Hyphomonadaceae bacterium]|nr:hypothetical protein [Hyphomonadaceae bacterium]